MAKFYIVAKEKDDYSLITVNRGNSLEDIDILTSDFNNKEEFIEYLRNKGYDFSDNVDLFVINKGRKNYYHRELIYGNKELAQLAIHSKEERLNVTDICNKLLIKTKENVELQRLIRRNAFDLYGDLKDMILKSLGFNYVRIGNARNWMRNNYYVGRDAIAAMDIFDKSNVAFETSSEFISKQKALREDRESVDRLLDKKLNYSNEQISLLSEPINYITLTYVNIPKLEEKTSKKLKRMQKMGIHNSKSVDDLTIPYGVITDKIDYRFTNNIVNCLLSLPYHKVKWGEKERYEIDFNKWQQKTGITLSDDDMKFLNGLIDIRLRQAAYWNRYYHNQTYPSSATVREEKAYQKSIFTRLKNSAYRHGDTYKKAYNFYLIYQEMTKEKEDVNERGHYGR